MSGGESATPHEYIFATDTEEPKLQVIYGWDMKSAVREAMRELME